MALATSFSSSFASMHIAVVIESVTLHPKTIDLGTCSNQHDWTLCTFIADLKSTACRGVMPTELLSLLHCQDSRI